MSNQYSYHLAIKGQAHNHFVERDETKNLLNTSSLYTKHFINYYYENIHSKNFNVKNSAYYNQLTRSSSFLNTEVSNNWSNDIHSLASINNLNLLGFSNPSLPSIPFALNEPQSFLKYWYGDNNNSNVLSKLYELQRSKSEITIDTNSQEKNNELSEEASTSKTFSVSFHHHNLKDEIIPSLSQKENISKEAIKDLISFNNTKTEKIIEDNLKKSYEKNVFVDYKTLKSKSNSHNSLHLVPSLEKIENLNAKKQKIETETKTEKTLNTEIVEKEEQIEDYASHPNYVFGYGSLINPDSRGCTVDSTKSARVIKVLAKGLERSWNYNCRDVYTAVGVSKVDDPSITCNGVIIPIDDPINDLPKLDERELHYRRVPLSRKNISIIHDDRNQGVSDEKLLAPDAIIWVYEIVDTFIPTTEIPISQIYVDCIISGCIKEGGIEFAKQFIENTHGWNTSVWVNDRTSEHFRKNISRCIIKLTDEIINSIDSLLTNNLSIDVNKRINPAY